MANNLNCAAVGAHMDADFCSSADDEYWNQRARKIGRRGLKAIYKTMEMVLRDPKLLKRGGGRDRYVLPLAANKICASCEFGHCTGSQCVQE